MAIVMNMSDYSIEREEAYGDEVLRAEWRPEVELACQSVASASLNRHVELPSSLAKVDVETFLEKMYALQR